MHARHDATVRRASSLLTAIGLAATALSAQMAEAQVSQVGAAFFAGATPLTFDDAPNGTSLKTRYTASHGITFDRDDGGVVVALDWASIGRTTVSPPTVLGTHGSPYSGHVNVLFSSVQHSFGGWFGNDQSSHFQGMRLSAFDDDGLLGSVYVAANGNTSVDQFIGLSSLTGFTWARFEIDQPALHYSVEIDDLVTGPGVVPEPTTFVLLAGGLAMVGVGALRRRRNSDKG